MFDELHQELDRINFVTVSIDASNMKEVKLVPIVVRYFLPESGVKVKLLEFKSVLGEIAEILSKYLLSVLDQTKLQDKLIGFCADNGNTNFGGVKRRGHNNVFYKLKDNIKRDLVGIGCRYNSHRTQLPSAYCGYFASMRRKPCRKDL